MQEKDSLDYSLLTIHKTLSSTTQVGFYLDAISKGIIESAIPRRGDIESLDKALRI
jgi:hypothetical protein